MVYTRLRDIESLKINPKILTLVDNTNTNSDAKKSSDVKSSIPKTTFNYFVNSNSKTPLKESRIAKITKKKWLTHKLYRLVKSTSVRYLLDVKPSSVSYMTRKLWRTTVRFVVRKRLPLFNLLVLLKLSLTSFSSSKLILHPKYLAAFTKKHNSSIFRPNYLLKSSHSRQNLNFLSSTLPKLSFNTDLKQKYFHPELYDRESFFSIRSKSCLAGGSWNFKRFTKYLFTEAYNNYGGIFFSKWSKITNRLTKKRWLSKKDLTLPAWKTCKNVLSELQKVYSYNYTNWFFSEPVRIFVKRHNAVAVHNLVLKFNQHQFFISLLDPSKRRNYFSLLPGLLLKHIEGSRKSAKKALTTKLLLMRFLRKLLIVSRIKNLTVLVKGVPLFIVQLFTFLNNPLTHVIKDPFTKKIIDETGDNYTIFNYFHLFFLRPKPYGYQKTRKKGRVKRKIRRKIARSARVIDEF